MLQQTQASTVIPYYLSFLQTFPNLNVLADAKQDDVMHAWAGLGYYARARNLQRCAQIIMRDHAGHFPQTAAALSQLPGIGPSTAAAIAAFAFDERQPILDGNVKRVLARYFGVQGDPSKRGIEQALWRHAHTVLDAAPAELNMSAYTQGQMDLGAQVCTRHKPNCTQCPLNTDCYARQHACQHTLPTPPVRRPVPERHCLMLILECQAHLLLYRQPSPGIWGGLWGLPQFDTLDTLIAACVQMGVADRATAISTPPLLPLAGVTHGFTHFRLHIEPWWLRSQARKLPPPPADGTWIPIHELTNTGMPAPLKKLLNTLYAAPTETAHDDC